MIAYPLPARYRQLEPSSILMLVISCLAVQRQTLLLTPEGHADTGNRVNHGESTNWFSGAGFPEGYLALAHLGESSRGEPVVFTHPHGSTILCTGVAGSFVHMLFLAHIPDTDLLVARSCGKQVTGSIPGQALDNVAVRQCEGRLASGDVPQLDRVVTGSGGKDVFGRRVEEDLSNFSAAHSCS